MRKVLIGLAIAALLAIPVSGWAQSNGPIVRSSNMQTAAAATGNGVILDTGQASIATIQVTGTFVGTVTFEASNNGVTYAGLFCEALSALNPITGQTAVTTATAVGMFRCNVAGIAVIRARISAYTSGSITVIGLATSLPSGSGNSLQN